MTRPRWKACEQVCLAGLSDNPVRIAVLLVACLTAILASAQTDTWKGGTGNWSDATKWSSGVPTASSNVVIDNGKVSAVTVDGGFNCNNLTIDASSSLTIPGGDNLTVNGTSIANAGKIVIDDTAGVAALAIAAGQSVALTGGGTVTMNDTTGGAAALIRGGVGSTLTNVNNTIQGSGQLGFGNGLALVNQAGGVINGNQTGRVLEVNPFAGFNNGGLMEATGGDR